MFSLLKRWELKWRHPDDHERINWPIAIGFVLAAVAVYIRRICE